MNDLIFYTHALNGLLMVAMPFILGIYLSVKLKLSWRLWFIGAAVFVLSQVGHIPFNALMTSLFKNGILPAPPEAWKYSFNILFLSFSAGLWEESFRYGAYRWWVMDARSWRQAVMLGAGHGGVEAFLLGILVLVGFINAVAARGMDLSTRLDPEQLQQAQQQLVAYWSADWYDTLLGALERLFTIPFHIAASVMMLQVFVRRQRRWYWFCLLWHTALNAIALFVLGAWGAYAAEGALGLIALLNLGIIFLLRRGEKTGEEPLPIRPPAPVPDASTLQHLSQVDESPPSLDDTRYN